MAEWINTNTKLPSAVQRVLVIYKDCDREHICIGEYVPPKTINAEGFIDDDCVEDLSEYDKEKDIYWAKEGWYLESGYDDCCGGLNFYEKDNVLYWQELPAWPK